MKLGSVAVLGTLVASLPVGFSAPAGNRCGVSSRSAASATPCGMSQEPTTAYFQDSQMKGGNLPANNSTRINTTLSNLLSSFSSEPKLYMITSKSSELAAEAIKNRVAAACGAVAVPASKETGINTAAEKDGFDSITRQMAHAEKGNSEASVSTIDAPGRNTFETCVSQVVNLEIANTSKQDIPNIAGKVEISTALFGLTGFSLVASAIL